MDIDRILRDIFQNLESTYLFFIRSITFVTIRNENTTQCYRKTLRKHKF